jgi:hypothetical protein
VNLDFPVLFNGFYQPALGSYVYDVDRVLFVGCSTPGYPFVLAQDCIVSVLGVPCIIITVLGLVEIVVPLLISAFAEFSTQIIFVLVEMFQNSEK